jgi:ATP-grasp ribosomal peptide maturase
MTVLVLAPERDTTADRMIRELGRRNVAVVRLETAWFPEHMQLNARFHNGRWDGTLTIRDRTIELSELRSVWYRSPSAFSFPTALNPAERQWASNEAKIGLGGVLSSLPLLWVNHPARQADAAAKPVQLTVASRCGLTVPETLITNSAQGARGFAADHPTVAKALSAPAIVESRGRSTAFTHLLDHVDLADLRGVEVTTHQFQWWVPKSYEARIVAVRDRVFVAGIHAGTAATRIDWRNSYNDLSYSRPELPDSVRAGLLRYLAEFGLEYGAFDMVINPDDDWVFLECNAGGQFGWIEDAIGAPITAALADLLTTEVTA